MRFSTLLLTVAVLLSGCGGGNGSQAKASPAAPASPSATASPDASSSASPDVSPSASPSTSPPPAPVTGSFGVLVTWPTAASYTISLIGVDGKVAASAQASYPPSPTCAGQAAGVVPYPVSTSNSRAYFMDATGAVWTLAPGGAKSQSPIIRFSTGPSSRNVFAVSPDDSQIAVAAITFVSGGATTYLYVDQLSGGPQRLIFSQSGSYILWPIGWHGGNLIVAKVPACTQGGGFGCCGPLELHVVNPANAVRLLIIGGTSCIISGPPTPGGASCETNARVAKVYSWTGALLRNYAIPSVGMGPIYLSPDGQHLALSTNPNQAMVEGAPTLNMGVCGWIDNTHIIAGGDAQSQPRIGNISTGAIVPVAALGDCAGRLPGGM